MLEAKPLTFLWKHSWNCLKWGDTSISVFRHHVPFHTSFRLKDFSQTEQNQLMSTPQEQNVDWDRGDMLRFYIGFQVIKFYCFPSTTTTFLLFSSSTTTTTATATTSYCFPLTTTTATTATTTTFYCFPSTTTTFLLFSSSTTTTTVTATATTFYCFPLTTTTATTATFLLFSILLLLVSFLFSSRFYKRLPTAIISSFGSNVSCTK